MYVRRFSRVAAVQFDGSRDSALRIAARFPFSVARSVQYDDVLLVTGRYGFSELRSGDWIVEELLTGALHVMADDHFRLTHEAPSGSEW